MFDMKKYTVIVFDFHTLQCKQKSFFSYDMYLKFHVLKHVQYIHDTGNSEINVTGLTSHQ